MDGGLQAGRPCGDVSATETSGLPREEGGVGREYNLATDEERQDQTDGRGRSDRGTAGTTEGLRADVVPGAEANDPGDREKSEDLINREIEFKMHKYEIGCYHFSVSISTIYHGSISVLTNWTTIFPWPRV